YERLAFHRILLRYRYLATKSPASRASALTDVFAEKFQSALACELRSRRIIGSALIAVEAVVGGVHIDRQIRMSLLELLNRSDRDVLVLFAEVQNHRNLRLLG